MRARSETGELETARRKAAGRDEWDCFVQCVKLRGKQAADLMRVELEEITQKSDRWSLDWMSGKGGFEDKHDPWLLPYEQLRQWATHVLKIEKGELEKHRAEFYKRVDNLPAYDFAFVGRAAQLAELEKSIEECECVCLSTSALHGIGGIGKTAIAYHYACSHRDRYTGIIWLDARRDILDQLFDFAHERVGLQLKGDGSVTERLADTFDKVALTLRGRILVVVDDVAANPLSEALPSHAEKQLELLTSSLPERLFGRYDLLLTARHTIHSVPAKHMQIGRMTGAEAIELFLQRSHFDRSHVDLAQLGDLVDALLGGHPLSIALLASHARVRRIKNISRLAALVRRSIADAEELRGTTLSEYADEDGGKSSIYATFKISFDQLSRDARLLLLTLAMFRRGVIAIAMLKGCAQHMKPVTEPVQALQRALTGGGGPTASARLLTRLALADRVDGANRSERSQVRSVQLHEVIYDFALVQWKKLRAEPEWQAILADLEISFTRGAIGHTSAKIDASNIEFGELESLTGLLLPQVRADLGLLPSRERVAESLTFWYQHFVFQNFVYDTGLQDVLLEQMISLRDYLESQQLSTGRCALILEKLIGHAYYANPQQTGTLALQSFDRALALADEIDTRHRPEEGEISIARWYRIFLLDHRSNVVSKNRPDDARTLAIRDDPLYAPDFDAIEDALPASLRQPEEAPTEEECELLLRAAHYWGHRGNQDSFIQYQRFIGGSPLAPDQISVAAREHYVKATNYRLLALKIFRTGQFERYVARLARQQQLPFLAPCMNTALSLKPQRRFESFTTLSQGIGDVAHQYRGLHFVFAIDFLAAADVEARAVLRNEAQRCLACARLLWDLAQDRLTDGEAPLRYRLWMSSSEIVMRLLDDIQAQRPIAPFQEVRQQFLTSTTRMQEQLRCSYPHSIQQQEGQLRAIWSSTGSA